MVAGAFGGCDQLSMVRFISAEASSPTCRSAVSGSSPRLRSPASVCAQSSPYSSIVVRTAGAREVQLFGFGAQMDAFVVQEGAHFGGDADGGPKLVVNRVLGDRDGTPAFVGMRSASRTPTRSSRFRAMFFKTKNGSVFAAATEIQPSRAIGFQKLPDERAALRLHPPRCPGLVVIGHLGVDGPFGGAGDAPDAAIAARIELGK